MRYSPDQPIEPRAVVSEDADNREFFDAVARATGREALKGAILLVGATGFRSLALRRAQAALRYDRLSSYWSHAALLVGWPKDAASAAGVEVTLEPEGPQAPERNGVSTFELSRYFDSAKYPNVALIVPSFSEGKEEGSRSGTLIEAALDPNRERSRFPLWDALASWAHYAYAPDATQNPLLSGVSMPSAALCEYAYGAAGADLTPGATADHTCPELIWATARHWSERLAEQQGVALSAFVIVRDPTGTPAPTLPDLAKDAVLISALEPARGSVKKAKAARGRKKGRSSRR